MGCGLEGGFYENACAILCSIFYRAGVPYVETSILGDMEEEYRKAETIFDEKNSICLKFCDH